MNQYEKTNCNLCHSNGIVPFLTFDRMPLTGIYKHTRSYERPYFFDQTLCYCKVCSHFQLGQPIDEALLYQETYSHKTSGSRIATKGNDHFFDFISRLSRGKTFDLALEIGSNDGYLLNKIKSLSTRRIGVDPNIDAYQDDKELRIRSFITPEFNYDLFDHPDLVISTSTFEHIVEIGSVLENVVKVSRDGCMFFVEVPGFEEMSLNGRWDQVFHQHVNYFTKQSLGSAFERLGCELVAFETNHGYWGGNLLACFTKNSKKIDLSITSSMANADLTGIDLSYKHFKEHLALLSAKLLRLKSDIIYGFGAAQMLPILAYHLQTDFGLLNSILDDDPNRKGLFYPYLVPPVEMPSYDFDWPASTILITALDSSREISVRLSKSDAKRILLPLPLLN